MSAIKPDTKIYDEDLPLLQKAGLDKIDKIALKFFTVFGGGNKIVEEQYRGGALIDKKVSEMDNYNIIGQTQPFLPQPIAFSNLLMGNWTNGLLKEEVEKLQLRYGLPIYDADTHIHVAHNRVYNLANLQDHCEYNILVNVASIRHDKNQCMPGAQAFYWERPEDGLSEKRERVKRMHEISSYIAGSKALPTSDKVLHLELYCYLTNTLYRPEMVQEELALEFDNVCIEDQERALRTIKLFQQGDALYRIYLYRLISNGFMEKREKDREFYARVSNEWQYAGEDWAAAIRYLKKPENAGLLQKAQTINQLVREAATMPTQNLFKSEFTEGLLTRDAVRKAEAMKGFEAEEESEEVAVVVDTAGLTKAKVSKMTTIELDQLYNALVTKGSVTAEEQSAYETLKTVSEKRVNIISKLNL